MSTVAHTFSAWSCYSSSCLINANYTPYTIANAARHVVCHARPYAWWMFVDNCYFYPGGEGGVGVDNTYTKVYGEDGLERVYIGECRPGKGSAFHLCRTRIGSIKFWFVGLLNIMLGQERVSISYTAPGKVFLKYRTSKRGYGQGTS